MANQSQQTAFFAKRTKLDVASSPSQKVSNKSDLDDNQPQLGSDLEESDQREVDEPEVTGCSLDCCANDQSHHPIINFGETKKRQGKQCQ